MASARSWNTQPNTQNMSGKKSVASYWISDHPVLNIRRWYWQYNCCRHWGMNIKTWYLDHHCLFSVCCINITRWYFVVSIRRRYSRHHGQCRPRSLPVKSQPSSPPWSPSCRPSPSYTEIKTNSCKYTTKQK